MGTTVRQFYRKINDSFAYCFNVESSGPLDDQQIERLCLLLADGFLPETVSMKPVLNGERAIEIGPRLNFATAWSSNMVSICRAIGLGTISRVERSRRYLVPPDENLQDFIAATMIE